MEFGLAEINKVEMDFMDLPSGLSSKSSCVDDKFVWLCSFVGFNLLKIVFFG